jgi:hypothetical protein
VRLSLIADGSPLTVDGFPLDGIRPETV